MDTVVYLALAVLAAVFLFSLFILIVMCHRRYEYNRMLMAHSLRFSKLHQDNLDDVVQLGPHISQKLNSNQWVEEVSGILQNCVAVLKLCHLLTEKMSKIQLNQLNPQLNELICEGTRLVVPRFDILLRSMAAKKVDIRVIEARVSALVSACWTLVAPFYMIGPKHKVALGTVVKEMEIYHNYLWLAMDQAEQDNMNASSDPSAAPAATTNLSNDFVNQNSDNSTADAKNNTNDEENFEQPKNDEAVVENTTTGSKPPYALGETRNSTAPPLIMTLENRKPLLDKSPALYNGDCVKLRARTDEALELISDEAPADPSSS